MPALADLGEIGDQMSDFVGAESHSHFCRLGVLLCHSESVFCRLGVCFCHSESVSVSQSPFLSTRSLFLSLRVHFCRLGVCFCHSESIFVGSESVSVTQSPFLSLRVHFLSARSLFLSLRVHFCRLGVCFCHSESVFFVALESFSVGPESLSCFVGVGFLSSQVPPGVQKMV